MSIFGKIVHDATHVADHAVRTSQEVLGNSHHHVAVGHRPERNEWLHQKLDEVHAELDKEHSDMTPEELENLYREEDIIESKLNRGE